METITKEVAALALKCSEQASTVEIQVGNLDAVHYGFERLVEKVEDIIHNGWHQERGMARMSLVQIERELRLIKLGFNPVMDKLNETAASLIQDSEKLADLV